MLEDTMMSSQHATPFQADGETLYDDLSSGAVRPLMTVRKRFLVFQQIHGTAHAGAWATWRSFQPVTCCPRWLQAYENGSGAVSIVRVQG
jgi:hypothetical protein